MKITQAVLDIMSGGRFVRPPRIMFNGLTSALRSE